MSMTVILLYHISIVWKHCTELPEVKVASLVTDFFFISETNLSQGPSVVSVAGEIKNHFLSQCKSS